MSTNTSVKDEVPAPPEPDIEPLPLSSRLILMAGNLPWWSIMLVTVIVGYGIYALSDPNQRSILNWLADRPAVTTDELFNVVYEIEEEVLLVNESYVVFDLRDQRSTVNQADVISVEENGVLECGPNASENCLNQRGTIVTYRDYRVEGAEPAGYIEREGVIVPSEGGFSINVAGRSTVTLPDGSTLLVAEADILEKSEASDAILACDRVANTNCTNFVGQYVKFRQAYLERQALSARVDVVIRHLSDGFERTIRPNRVLSKRAGVLACGEDAPEGCIETEVTYVTYPERIIGIEVDKSDGVHTIRTVQEETATVERSRVLSMEMGLIECNTTVDPRCKDFEGTIIGVQGESFKGQLTGETSTKYNIIVESDDTATEFDRRDIAEESRTPPGCLVEDEGDCTINIVLKDSQIGGRIIKETDTAVTLELVPEKLVKVNEDDIINVNTHTPASCALNNIRGCNAGIWLTIVVTITAYFTALFVGLFMGLFRVSSNPILYHLSTFYVELVRGVPLLVLLLYFAFVIGPSIRDSEVFYLWPLRQIYSVVTEVEIQVLGQESFLAEATIGLAIGYGAFMAEIFRAGIQSIPKGQMEAARSMGMSYPQAMRHVVLPQATRVVLPPLGNEFIAILKDSALISVLALPDLLQQGRVFITQTFQPKPTYNMVAWLYIVMTLVLSMGVRIVERRSRLP